MANFFTGGRRQALALLLALSACREESVMPETEVVAADEAAVLRMFDEWFHGGRDHGLREPIALEFVDSFTGICRPEGVALRPGGAS